MHSHVADGDAGARPCALVDTPEALPAVEQARLAFPRGLSQPDTGFRFSADALLLAAFARRLAGPNVLDLGTGCGAVGLSLALNRPDFFITGLDHSLTMLVHAQANARKLGLAGRFSQLLSDVRQPGGIRPESMDLVVCNPPYRAVHRGRPCPDAGKFSARFEQTASVADFIRAASFFLGHKKTCVLIHLAERLDDLLQCLSTCRLSPRELLCIHPRPDKPARLVLVRAVKNGGSGMTILPPLYLHDEKGFSSQALHFCPELGSREAPSCCAATGLQGKF